MHACAHRQINTYINMCTTNNSLASANAGSCVSAMGDSHVTADHVIMYDAAFGVGLHDNAKVNVYMRPQCFCILNVVYLNDSFEALHYTHAYVPLYT